MGALSGRQFFTWEVVDLLNIAYNAAQKRVMAELDYVGGPTPGHDAFISLATIRVDNNRRVNDDQTSTSPHLYRTGDSHWAAVDKAVSLVATDPAVLNAVAGLPLDPGTPGSNKWWVKPAAFGAAVLGVLWLIPKRNVRR